METVLPSATMNKKKYMIINLTILCLFVLSLVLQLVGVLTPGWRMIHYRWRGQRINTGIWYVKYCPDTEPCFVRFVPTLSDSLDEDGLMRHHLLEYQVCTALAIASSIGGLVAMVMVLKNKIAKTTDTEANKCFIFCFIGMLALVSGSLTMEIGGAYGSSTKKLHDTYQASTSSQPPVIYFPYSVFLVFLGGLTAAIVWLIIIFMRPWRYAPGPSYEVTNGGMNSTATHYPSNNTAAVTTDSILQPRDGQREITTAYRN